MSLKAHKASCDGAEGEQAARGSSPLLLSLPDPVVAHVVQCSKKSSGHPMLQLSRGCRDAVLQSCSRICVSGHTANPQSPDIVNLEPLARLLHRACTAAAPGTTIKLDLTNQESRLPQLLQRGIETGGWGSIQKLEVSHVNSSSYLLASVFPSLRELNLSFVNLGDGALFTMLGLQPNCTLTSLTLASCRVDELAVTAAAAALGRLPSLQSLHIKGTLPLSIAYNLTRLTSLGGWVKINFGSADDDLLNTVTRNSQLGRLTVHASLLPNLLVPGGYLMRLLPICAPLTELDLTDTTLDDEGVDVLLKHGTNIQQLTLGNARLTLKRTDRTARWQRLKLTSVTVLTQLAYLPLKSVQVLTFGHAPGTLPLALTAETPAVVLLPLLHQAISNLLTCPAWHKQPATRILLYTHSSATYGPGVVFDSYRLPLFSLLARIGGPHVQHLSLSMAGLLGRGDVEVLARSLGGNLTSLYLRRCNIQPTFWPALSQHFPSLKRLAIGRNRGIAVHGIVPYLQTVPKQFTLCMAPDALELSVINELRDCLHAWQLQRVQLSSQEPEEESEFRNVNDCGSVEMEVEEEEEEEEEIEEEEEEEEEEEPVFWDDEDAAAELYMLQQLGQ